MDEINTSASNFIYDFIDEDLKNGVNTRPVSHPSRTATCISATQRLSA